MKYMNNHYGQSRIFGNARCKMPMNLQFFAESGEGGDVGTGSWTSPSGETGSWNGAGDDEDSPTVEELLTQLAEERARSARLQNDKDAASTEAANYKKQLRAKMTADEAAQAEKDAAEAAKDARIQELESKFRTMDYSKRYMGIGRDLGVGMDEKSATELAELTGEISEPDKFFSALDKFVRTVSKKSGESAIETIIKNNPSVKAGNGGADENETAFEMARASASRTGEANTDILKHYIAGGKK